MANAVTVFVNRLGESPRVHLLLLGTVTFAVVWGLFRWGMAPSWVPVAPGLPLERIAEATQRLDESGIEYRLERGGTLMTVPDRDVARARVLLAGDGLTGTATAPGFELFDQPSWSMTDFTQRVNYRRALEGELERTIGRMRGVESAQVHLALRERSFLRSEDESSEASVVLSLDDGSSAGEAVVQGVQSLVASSVDGLNREHVTVIDDRGRLLSEPDDASGAGLTNSQLRARTQIEEYLEQKAEAVTTQIVGPGNATIRVAADLNFDQIDRTVQAVDPNQATLLEENRAEITPGSEAQGAGSVQSSTVFETTRSLETFSRSGARVERLTVAVVVADRRVEAADGTVTFEGRTPAELAQVEALVSNAVGLAPARGDQISVVGAPQEVSPVVPIIAPDEGFDYANLALAVQRPLVALAGLAVALVLGLRILGAINLTAPVRRDMRQLAAAPQATPAPQPVPALPEPAAAATLAPPPGVKVADPEMTARVLKSWMKDNA